MTSNGGFRPYSGRPPYSPEGRGSGNSRNGYSPKRVTTDIGEVDLSVPRDRAGS
ncbi:MAG: IS256 family transposase, partial [bacterium]|nr:IS256 family transposase [bacterium]